MKKTVVITGASSGFGRLTAQKFQKEGWNVIATMRSPEKETVLDQLENVWVTRLDVTDKDSIQQTITEGILKFKTIDALVNNAGYGIVGYLEEASESEIRKQVDTNLIGLINVIQGVLPQMRKQKRGAIINISSIGGNIGMPMFSLYSATKFAVEGLSESLAYELKEFGIAVKTIAPGAFKTGFGNSVHFLEGNAISDLDEPRAKYINNYKKMLEHPPKPFGFGEPQLVADTIFYAVTNKSKHRIFVGKDAKMLNRLNKWMGHKFIFNTLYKSMMSK